MHCRRVRSYLSAFSNDELTGALLRDVREHLSTCPDCRREEAVYRSMRLTTKQMQSRQLSSDFNSRLIDRLAQERFAETRTRAYLPKPAPWLLWRKLVPMAVSVVAVALMAVNLLQVPDDNHPNKKVPPVSIAQNDDYLTAMPLKRDWTLNNQLAQTDRLSRLTNSLTQPAGFSGEEFASQAQPGLVFRDGRPYLVFIYPVPPVIRVYDQSGRNVADKENDKVY